jgi:hypothetical protein
MRPIEEKYTLSADGVTVTTRLLDNLNIPTRLVFPALVSDGAVDTEITLDRARAIIRRRGGTLVWQAQSPAGLIAKLEGPRVPTRNGYIQTLAVELPAGTREVSWHLDLQADTRALAVAAAVR